MSLKTLSDHPHAKLLFIWSALDLILFSAGILTVIASICFHRPKQLIINLVFDDIHFVCKLLPSLPLSASACMDRWSESEGDHQKQGGKRTTGRRKDEGIASREGGGLMTGGLVLGSAYLTTCIFSIPAIFLGKGRLWALKALNWGLVVLILATLLASLST
jgi:hypothetical protein